MKIKNNPCLKYAIFTIHWTGITCTLFGVIFFKQLLIIHPIVFASWLLNSNKCLFTQIEYYLFKETIFGYGARYIVPYKMRILLVYSFWFGLVWNFLFDYIIICLDQVQPFGIENLGNHSQERYYLGFSEN